MSASRKEHWILDLVLLTKHPSWHDNEQLSIDGRRARDLLARSALPPTHPSPSRAFVLVVHQIDSVTCHQCFSSFGCTRLLGEGGRMHTSTRDDLCQQGIGGRCIFLVTHETATQSRTGQNCVLSASYGPAGKKARKVSEKQSSRYDRR